MPASALIKKSLLVSLGSFLLGTSLFAWFYCSDDWLATSLYSMAALLAVGAVNLYFLLRLLWRAQQRAHRPPLLRAAALLCLNIPVALLYGKLVVVLLNTLVVRLVNDTGQPLTHVALRGCAARPLANLPPHSSTMLWLPITKNCIERSVLVQYTAGGFARQALIAAYVVEGKRITCRLGSSRQLPAASARSRLVEAAGHAGHHGQ